MKFNIQNQGAGLTIRIEEVAGQEQTLVEAIRQCRKSAWACPSGECMNAADIVEHVEQGSVVLTITPRPDAQLDPSGIEQCLRYMLPQAVKG
jgi:hypothetical protein